MVALHVHERVIFARRDDVSYHSGTQHIAYDGNTYNKWWIYQDQPSSTSNGRHKAHTSAIHFRSTRWGFIKPYRYTGQMHLTMVCLLLWDDRAFRDMYPTVIYITDMYGGALPSMRWWLQVSHDMPSMTACRLTGYNYMLDQIRLAGTVIQS